MIREILKKKVKILEYKEFGDEFNKSFIALVEHYSIKVFISEIDLCGNLIRDVEMANVDEREKMIENFVHGCISFQQTMAEIKMQLIASNSENSDEMLSFVNEISEKYKGEL